jgi:hypothetical protein
MTTPTTNLRRALLAALLATVAAATLLWPAPAQAGQFPINVCRGKDPGGRDLNYGVLQAFTMTRRGRGVRLADQCANQARGDIPGFLVADRRDGGRTPFRARAAWTMRAPAGTHFRGVKWGGQVNRSDCGYELQAYVDEGSVPADKGIALRFRRGGKTFGAIRNAGKDCPKPGKAQASGDPRPIEVSTGSDTLGARRVVLRMECRDRGGCASRGSNYLRTTSLTATVVDNTAPQVGILTGPAGTSLSNGAWTPAGVHPLPYTASDITGIREAAVGTSADTRACSYNKPIPCASGPGTVPVQTGDLPEGTQKLAVTALDAANNPTPSAPVDVRIDRKPPAQVPVGVVGGEGWRNTPVFALAWGNPDEGDRAPITATRYRVDGGAEQRQAGDALAGLNITAPAPGEHTVTMWREDAAGNQEPANASPAVALRYDPEPPTLAFEPLATADPTRIAVPVTDRVSGLAGGQVEISRQGSGAWQALPTTQEASQLVARIDDSQLAAGRYQLRARAFDQARNEASTDRRSDGQAMVVDLPLRNASKLQTGVARKKVVRRKVGRRGKRRTVRRRITVFDDRRRVRIGRKVKIAGRLTNRDGQPISGARLAVTSRDAATPEKLVAYVTTGKRGRYNYTARASSSRTLRFVYPGSEVILPATRQVKLVVPASSTIKVRPRSVVNGQKVAFRGRLRAPRASKLVELQVRVKGAWQTFRTARTGPKSAWRIPYRFARSCGMRSYRFRLRIPREGNYPYATGASPTTKVRVRGRPCP